MYTGFISEKLSPIAVVDMTLLFITGTYMQIVQCISMTKVMKCFLCGKEVPYDPLQDTCLECNIAMMKEVPDCTPRGNY